MSKRLYMKINIGGDVEVPCEKVVFEGFHIIPKTDGSAVVAPRFKDYNPGYYPMWVKSLFKNNLLQITALNDNSNYHYLTLYNTNKNGALQYLLYSNYVLIRYKCLHGDVNYTVMPMELYRQSCTGHTEMEEF